MKELKATIETNSLLYTGEVTIKKIKKGKPYYVTNKKNKSTKDFHKFLLNCILGNFDANLAPCQIGFYKVNGTEISLPLGDTFFKGVATTSEPINGPVETYKNTDCGPATIYYHFLIPETYSTSINEFNMIKLVNITGDKTLAFITVGESDSDTFSMESGISLDISWKITLSNK